MVGWGTRPQDSQAWWLVTIYRPHFLFMYPQGVTPALGEGSRGSRAFRPSAHPAQR